MEFIKNFAVAVMIFLNQMCIRDRFREITPDAAGVAYCGEKLSDVLDAKYAEDLQTIIRSVDAVRSADFKIVFDPTLVRGMSYYTCLLYTSRCV